MDGTLIPHSEGDGCLRAFITSKPILSLVIVIIHSIQRDPPPATDTGRDTTK
jgi:hypothetical protein